MKRIPQMITAVTLAAVLGVLAVPAAAQSPASRLDRRVWRQQQRIERGIRCDQLGRREARRLYVGQRHIRRMELRARADGRVGPYERLRIRRALDRQDARIWHLRHNGRAI